MRGYPYHMATGQLKDNDSGTNKMGDAEERTQRAMSQHCGRLTRVPRMVKNVVIVTHDSKMPHDLNISWRS